MLLGTFRRQAIVFALLSLAPIVAFCFFVHPTAVGENRSLFEVIYVLPYFLLGAVSYFGLRLNQTRIFYAAVVILLSYLFLGENPISEWFDFKYAMTRGRIMAFGVPLSLLLIFSLKEGALTDWKGLVRFFGVVLVFGLLISLSVFQWNAVKPTLYFQFFSVPGLRIGHLGVLFVFALGGLIAIIKDPHIRTFLIALVASMVPLLFAYNIIPAPNFNYKSHIKLGEAATFSTVGVVLLMALFRLYWQKVYIDELTQIPNRRALDERLHSLGRTYSIAMCDIDFFKKFNDNYGHEEGDNVLRFVGAHFSRQTSGRAFRYGGEEFAVLFPGLGAEEAQIIMEKARRTLAERDFYIRMPSEIRLQKSKKDRGSAERNKKRVHITCSIGIAARSKDCPNPEAVMSAADKALYQAKESGRNKAILART